MVIEARKILVVEDQPREREAMALADQSVELVISDLRLGDESAIVLLTQLRRLRTNLPFIVVTAYGDVGSAVNAMKLGAIDYLAKPLNPTELISLIRRHLSGTQPTTTETGSPGFENMLGRSLAMRTLFDRIRRAALSDSTVLITGESGTGKELVASANCLAILESIALYWQVFRKL